jgi:hypothetical protein
MSCIEGITISIIMSILLCCTNVNALEQSSLTSCKSSPSTVTLRDFPLAAMNRMAGTMNCVRVNAKLYNTACHKTIAITFFFMRASYLLQLVTVFIKSVID